MHFMSNVIKTRTPILKSGNGDSKQCRNRSTHDMNELFTKFHVFSLSHFEATDHFVFGSFLALHSATFSNPGCDVTGRTYLIELLTLLLHDSYHK